MTLEICGFAKAAPIPIATMPTTVAANRASEPPARAAANRSRSPIAIWLKAMAKKRFHRCILSAAQLLRWWYTERVTHFETRRTLTLSRLGLATDSC